MAKLRGGGIGLATPPPVAKSPKSVALPYNMYGGDPAYNINGGNAVEQNQMHASIGQDSNNTTPGPDRTQYGTLAPPGMERRVMQASRVGSLLAGLGVSYPNVDPQKGGAPGAPGSSPEPGNHSDMEAATNFITSQSPSGIDTHGGVPVAQLKLSYGASDWASSQPTALPAHLKIAIAQNPNAAQRNVGIWASEGQMANTKYTSPAPWAEGTYIG